jgi:hypothetical protein
LAGDIRSVWPHACHDDRATNRRHRRYRRWQLRYSRGASQLRGRDSHSPAHWGDRRVVRSHCRAGRGRRVAATGESSETRAFHGHKIAPRSLLRVLCGIK